MIKPLDRSPERALRDVRDEHISPEAASRDYGVVVVDDPATDPEGLRIDPEATARRRAELISTISEGARPWNSAF